MSIITRQEEIDGRWYAWIITEGFNTMMVEDNHEITEAEAEQKLLDWQASQIVIPEVTDGVTQ
jgi:hypothetical protein